MNQYDTNLKEIKRNITAQKTIYKFRNFLYSINKDIRRRWFEISREYFDNEYRNSNEITATERDRLFNLLNHWIWDTFENTSTNWWYQLSINHSHSVTLMTLIHLWVDDVEIFDSENFETSTDGLR